MGHSVSFSQIMHSTDVPADQSMPMQEGEALLGWNWLLIQRDAIKSGHVRILRDKRYVQSVAH